MRDPTRIRLAKNENVRLRAQWIKDTQMFQRIAGTSVSSDEELGGDWDAMKSGHLKIVLPKT